MKDKPHRFTAMGIAVLLMLSGAGLTVATPQEESQDDQRLEQLQRELRDLNKAYEALKKQSNAPRATSPAQARSLPGLRSNRANWSVEGPAGIYVDANPFERSKFGVARFPARTIGKETLESGRRVQELTVKIRQSEDDAEKAKLKNEIEAELGKQYDAYLKGLEEPVKKMEERLAKLQEQLEKRKELRDEMVQHRLNAIWYQANGMDWPAGNSWRGFSNEVFFGVPIDPAAIAPLPPSAPEPDQLLDAPQNPIRGRRQ